MRAWLSMVLSLPLACGGQGGQGSTGSTFGGSRATLAEGGGAASSAAATIVGGSIGTSVTAAGVAGAGAVAASICPSETTNLAGSPSGRKALAVSGGLEHMCVLLDDGTVKCWGGNSYGQLGVGRGCLYRSFVPLKVVGISNAVGISSGELHTCARIVDGSVKCWGEQPAGVCNSTCPMITSKADADSLSCAMIVSSWTEEQVGCVAGAVPGLGDAVVTSGGNHQDCALVKSGAVRCWGWAGEGELGNGEASNNQYSTPVYVLDVSQAIGVAAGPFHGCAVIADGTMKCWGTNESGQLGNGSTTATQLPTTVLGIHSALQVVSRFTAGSPKCNACDAFTCALLADHTVSCWGSNQDGELGNGTSNMVANPLPAPVPNLAGVQDISVGEGKVYAIRADGSLVAWGSNRCGEIGDGTFTDVTSPFVVPGLAQVVSASGSSCTSCAVTVDGSLYCWGISLLGDGSDASSPTPTRVDGL